MTDNKPWLLVLAAAVAGAVSSGALLLLEAGAWVARATGQNWHVSSDAYAFWLLAGVPVFLRVVAVGIVAEHSRIATQKAADLEQQRAKTELAWAQVEVTRAALDSVPAADEVAPEQDDEKAEAVRRWLRAGDRLGFGINAMCPSVVRRQDWPWFQSFYVSDAGWGLLQWIGGQAATEWAEGWNLATAMSELDAGRLPLPPGKPPTVHILVVNTTQEMRKHNVSGQGRGASEVVIDQ